MPVIGYMEPGTAWRGTATMAGGRNRFDGLRRRRTRIHRDSTSIKLANSPMKALIATDGSSYSFDAVRQASRLLSPARDQIVLYYSPPGACGARVDANALVQGQSALCEAIFAEALKHFPDMWRNAVEKLVGGGDPRTDIVKSAERCKANLIVMGARGLGAVARVLLGSVSRSVVHTSSVPVLIAHERKAEADESNLRVLLACTNLEAGRTMATALEQFAWPEASTCDVITVVPSVLGGAIPDWLSAPTRSADVEKLIRAWVEEEKAELAEFRQTMEAVCQLLPAAFGKRAAIVSQGYAASAILDTARKHGSDLIVVGTKGTTPLGRFFIGSTCEAVLNGAPCSVLVIPHR